MVRPKAQGTLGHLGHCYNNDLSFLLCCLFVLSRHCCSLDHVGTARHFLYSSQCTGAIDLDRGDKLHANGRLRLQYYPVGC